MHASRVQIIDSDVGVTLKKWLVKIDNTMFYGLLGPWPSRLVGHLALPGIMAYWALSLTSLLGSWPCSLVGHLVLTVCWALSLCRFVRHLTLDISFWWVLSLGHFILVVSWP